MQSAKYVIVGCGVAGSTAASTVRQYDTEGSILLIGDEPHPLYSRVALPGYTRNKVSRERVFLKDEAFYQQLHIDRLTQARATALDIEEKVLTLSDGQRIGYDRLLIATGGAPRDWGVPGSYLPGVLPMRTIDQADEIKERITHAKHVIVVGGGFITLEHIQTLAAHGVAGTVVVRDPYYWANVLDEESAKLLEQLFVQAPNVDILYKTEIEEVFGQENVSGVVLSSGRKIAADVVLTNLGIRLNTTWLEGSGLQLSGGVVTNEYLETDAPDVYAAGDVTLSFDPLLGMHHHQGNWNNASNQGKIAGLNLSGQRQAIDSVSMYSISLFGVNISFVGQTSAHPSMTVVPRGSARSGSYGRLIIHDDRLVGATLIHRFPEREAIIRLIQSRVRVAPHLGDLADETIALKDLADRLIPPS